MVLLLAPARAKVVPFGKGSELIGTHGLNAFVDAVLEYIVLPPVSAVPYI